MVVDDRGRQKDDRCEFVLMLQHDDANLLGR